VAGTPDDLKRAEKFAREVVEDPSYKIGFKARAIAGALSPLEVKMLWAYAYGEPPKRVEVSATVNDYRDKSPEELVSEAEASAKRLHALLLARATAREVVQTLEDSRQPEPARTHFADLAGKHTTH
jgi:hypothetical protein